METNEQMSPLKSPYIFYTMALPVDPNDTLRKSVTLKPGNIAYNLLFDTASIDALPEFTGSLKPIADDMVQIGPAFSAS